MSLVQGDWQGHKKFPRIPSPQHPLPHHLGDLRLTLRAHSLGHRVPPPRLSPPQVQGGAVRESAPRSSPGGGRARSAGCGVRWTGRKAASGVSGSDRALAALQGE